MILNNYLSKGYRTSQFAAFAVIVYFVKPCWAQETNTSNVEIATNAEVCIFPQETTSNVTKATRRLAAEVNAAGYRSKVNKDRCDWHDSTRAIVRISSRQPSEIVVTVFIRDKLEPIHTLIADAKSANVYNEMSLRIMEYLRARLEAKVKSTDNNQVEASPTINSNSSSRQESKQTSSTISTTEQSLSKATTANDDTQEISNRLSLATGITGVHAFTDVRIALGPFLSLTHLWQKQLGVRLSLHGPIWTEPATGLFGKANIYQGLMLAELLYRQRLNANTATTSRFIIGASVGVGAYMCQVRTKAAAPFIGRNYTLWSAAFNGGLYFAFLLSQRFSLFTEGHVMKVLRRLEIEMFDQKVTASSTAALNILGGVEVSL